MTGYVLDASAMGPLLFSDEIHFLIPDLVQILESGTCLVPQHWPLEIGNFLLTAIRRQRLVPDELPERLILLQTLNISVDYATSDHALSATLRYADLHSLTTYDAAYLELAIRTGRTLITHDKALARAARKEKITVLTQ